MQTSKFRLFGPLLAACLLLTTTPGLLRADDDDVKKTKQNTDVYDGNKDMKLPPYKGIRHAIGCKDFDNDAGYAGQWKLSHNLTVMLESALFDTGRFVLVEREKLASVTAEQDLVTSGRAAKAGDAAQTGKLRPAKYLGTGTLVEVEENQSGVGGGLGFGPIRVGGSHKKAQITLIVKLVDTTTGEIVAKERMVGKSGTTALNIGGGSHGFGGDLGGFTKTPLGEAAQDCINQAAKFIAKQMEQFPVDGSVVVVSNGRVIINRGSSYNFAPGMVLNVQTEGEVLTDPDTGALLDKVPGKQLGTIKITDVKEKISICQVLSGEPNPPRGATVTIADTAAPPPPVEEKPK